MFDTRYNDISCKLRSIAQDLEKQAHDHRNLAAKLDHIAKNPPPEYARPAALIALDKAASKLIDLPAKDIRTQAPVVARQTGQEVLPVAIRAQQLRAQAKAHQRRVQTVQIMTALANGEKLKDAAAKLGISEATARRLRDSWRDRD